MPDRTPKPGRIWTVAEARARLSEVLRLSVEEGPQRIGKRRSYVVVPAAEWDTRTHPRPPLGQWLVENLPRGANFDPPRERGSARAVAFGGGDGG